MPGVKAKLARAFLNFLDEHGDYRTTLEEAAARAAAAEAGALWAKDRRGRKKRRRRGRGLLGEDDEGEALEGEEEYEEEAAELPPPQPKHPALPEDPYEQIQFYFKTFTHRTQLQLEDKLEQYRTLTQKWVHDELHHPARVPLLSGGMLLATLLLWGVKVRRKKISGIARVHGILGKKLNLKDYLVASFLKGRMLLRFSTEGKEKLDKMGEKADKAEAAALASMRPYQRKKYERFVRLERMGEGVVTFCLALGVLASGITLILSLAALIRGEHLSLGEEERLDGHIYSLDGPTDSDGYPIGMRELAEEKYAACLWEAEEAGIEDPTTVCDVESFFDEAAHELHRNGAAEEAEGMPASPLRTKIHGILVARLRVPPALAAYLTTLRSQTIAYLSSLVTFLLFLTSHYVAHKIHLATIAHDPMKHFVLAATDKSVKADGTVEAKRGETEAQRKRRERMLQNERLKAKMAQLAAEAKQKVDERRERLEGAAAAEREKAEADRKVAEEQEEIATCHSRQFMMLKAGVPDGAIVNSLLAEGLEEGEAREIVAQLKAARVRRAEEATKREEEAAQKAEREKEAEEERERMAQERLRRMKGQRGQWSKGSSMGGGGSVGGGSVGSVGSSSVKSKASIASDPSMAKSAMLGQIAGGGEAFGKAALKPASLRQTPKSIPSNPAPRPGSSTVLSGNMPIGAKSDKRWDRETKAWVAAEIDTPWGDKEAATASREARGTPRKSNVSKATNHGAPWRSTEEEKKGDEAVVPEGRAATEARETVAAAALPPEMPLKTAQDLTAAFNSTTPAKEDPGHDSDSSDTPVLVRICGSPDGEGLEEESSDAHLPGGTTKSGMMAAAVAGSVDPFQRPSVKDIQAQITAVENEPEEVDLAPAWMHSPAFEMALRNSNASWDCRPSSRDISARIKAVEQYEQRKEEPRPPRASRSVRPAPGDDAPPDDEISELSEPTYVSKEDAFGGRTVPRSLFVPQTNGVELSPMVTGASALSPPEATRNFAGGKGELPGPPPLEDIDEKAPQDAAKMDEASEGTDLEPVTPPKEETAEEAKRRERAAARAKKMEALAARRNAGHDDDDDASAVSGLSKRRSRLRRKKQKEAAALAAAEETSVPSNDAPVREETKEEQQRKRRAEARAAKLAAMAARRNAGEAEDDATAVTGISRRHRLRRKKSALAAIGPEERERNEWKKGVFGSVVKAEQTRWRTSVYAHVLEAEAAREANVAAARQLEEQNAAAQKKLENQKRLDAKAKKFAARAERFHQIRREGGDDDDASAVSAASRMRRRRGRKSSGPHRAVATVDEGAAEPKAIEGKEESMEAAKTARDGAAMGEENVAPDDGGQSAVVTDDGGTSSMKKMRNRRRKAGKKKKANS
ncbi:hypothetical protein ACHAXT_003969 [Thalassiosira profunda]